MVHILVAIINYILYNNNINSNQHNIIFFKIIFMDLLNDLDKLPKQTIGTKAEGNKGEIRSISIPVLKE